MSQENLDKKVDESWKDKAKQEDLSSDEKGQEHPPLEPSLAFFLTSLGMQAYMALGVVANPATNQTHKDLDQAKYIIDILGILEEKTKGNRDKDETEILEHLLADLRLAYVRESASGAAAP